MYNVGMYGGSFDPIHMGHVNTIIRAASICKELHIILSYSKTRDNINYKQRHQWLVQLTKDIENIVIHNIEDKADSKSEYNWEDGANNIKDAIGKHIDAVFCGDDYKGKNIFEQLYPDSTIVYTERNIIPISSTQIRTNPMTYWNYIPNIVKPYYTKKILIIGGESTGKSTLTRNLALAFNTNYVEEVGREVSSRAKSEDLMLDTDFYEIIIRHKALEYEKMQSANKVLFIDTDCLTTLFYSKFLCTNKSITGNYDMLASSMANFNQYEVILFLDTDVEFVQDGTRNDSIAADRELYSNRLKREFDSRGIKYEVIKGNYLDRFNKAYNIVREILE